MLCLVHLLILLFHRANPPRPPSRQEKPPPHLMIKDSRGIPRSTSQEDIVWPRRNPTSSGSSQQDRARSPGESASLSSPRQRNASRLSRPWGSSQSWDRMTTSLSRQPANLEPNTILPRVNNTGMFNGAETVVIHGGTFFFIAAGECFISFN